MNTTISDLSKFAAALVRGDGLTPASRAEIAKPSLHITTAGQFPPFQPDLPVSSARTYLLGWASLFSTARKGTAFTKAATRDRLPTP